LAGIITTNADGARQIDPRALVQPIHPDLDLVNFSTRLPRHIAGALDMLVRLGRVKKQEITAQALRAALPADALDENFTAFYPDLDSPYAEEAKALGRREELQHPRPTPDAGKQRVVREEGDKPRTRRGGTAPRT
jgi:hypothetical protein